MHRLLVAMLFLLAVGQTAWAQKDFTLTLSPPSQTLNAGRQAVFTITAQPLNGLKKPVVLSLTSSSGDATATLSSATINPGGSVTLTVDTSAQAIAQTATITVTGTFKKKIHSVFANLTINVPQFNLTLNPSTALVQQGDIVDFAIKSQGEQDFARTVTLNVNTTPAFPFQLSKQTLSPPNDTATLEVNTANLPVGGFVANITATAGDITRTGTITFTVVAKQPGSGAPDIQVILSTVNQRADQVGHLVVTGIAQNVGGADAAFVQVKFKVFDKNNNLVETGSTFINGFPGLTSTGLFTNTTLPRGKKASFQKVFDLTFVSNAQRVEFSFDFVQNTITAPKANLVVLSLDRVINVRGGSDYAVRVQNTGTVGARAPQIVIDSFDRANQVFDVTFAGKGDPNDLFPAGTTRTFTATSDLPFDETRVNEQHAIWIDASSFTVTQEIPEDLTTLEKQRVRDQINKMQKMAHLLRLANQ